MTLSAAMRAQLSVSVVVATRNRADCLRRLLPSLCQLTYEPLEVIVVVGPSEDDTLDVVGEYRTRMKVVSSPAANMCLSRNIGLAQAAGDIVVFIDDDGVPAGRGWIDALVQAFAREPRVGAAGGPVLYQDTATFQFRNGAVSQYGEHIFVTPPDGRLEIGPGWFARAMGTNAAFRREALVRIGGFDERIGYYGDECDVCVRLAAAGYTYAFVDRAPVRHYPAPSAHRDLIGRTRALVHDDTYFCLRNAGASFPVRLATTTLKAFGKHYIREVLDAWRAGRVPAREFARFLWLAARGYGQAVRESAFTPRRVMVAPNGTAPRAETPSFLRLPRLAPRTRRSIVLTARQLACDGPCEGPARYTWDLAEALHELGHDVHVIGESSSRTRHLKLGFTVHGIAPSDITDHLFPAQPILDGNVAYAVAVAERVRELQRSGTRLDALHTTNWNFEGLGVLLDQTLPVMMMLVTSLGEVIEYEHWAVDDDLEAGLWLDRAQMQAASALFAPTRGLIRKYLDTRLVDEALAGRIAVSPLGIVPRRLPAMPNGAPASEAPRGSAAPNRLLFVGTHVRRKGLDDLLAVLPELLWERQDWACDIVGDDTRIVEDGRTLKAQFLDEHDGEGWLNRVVFHGRVPDEELWHLYSSASLYVVPSRFESFGLTYLEAMQFGVPVVATRTGGIPEVVRDTETGLLAEVGDRVALRAALTRLMADDELRGRLGRAAREDVQARWTHLHMATRLLPLYDAAIEGWSARAGSRARRRAGEPTSVRSLALLDFLAKSGAPRELVDRLRNSMAIVGGDAVRARLVNAAAGRLPAADLYVAAVERCLELTDAPRALRLVADARAFAPDPAPGPMEELSELDLLARWLVGDGHGHARGVRDAATPVRRREACRAHPGTTSVQRLKDALTLVREGRVALGASQIFSLLRGGSLSPLDRLSASYHFGSALKRCGFVDEGAGWLKRVTGDAAFPRLPVDVRAAAWFHLGDLARAAGRRDDALEGFSRCLDINPQHGRAASLRSEMLATRTEVGVAS
jgi:hypothetical protein